MEKAKFNTSVFVGPEKHTRKYQRKYLHLFQPEQKVLDIGCGTGVFLEMLREANISGVGVESSQEEFAQCKKKNLEVHQVDAFRFLSRHRDEFHGVFCSHFVEHFDPTKVLDLFKKVHNVLTSQGLFVIITPNFKNIDVISETFWLDISHVRPYPIPLLERMLEHSGLSVVDSGIDSDTNQRLPKREPWKIFGYLLKKIRFGEYFAKGDSFVIARKR